MAEFRFSLQRLLDMRHNAVTDCERKLEHFYRMRDQLRELLMSERNLYLGERTNLNDIVQKGELSRIPVYEGSLDMRKARMLKVLEYIREVEGEIDLLSQTLVNLRRDVKIVENLRDKRSHEFHRAVEMRERKMIDEQAMMRYLRREVSERWEDET